MSYWLNVRRAFPEISHNKAKLLLTHFSIWLFGLIGHFRLRENSVERQASIEWLSQQSKDSSSQAIICHLHYPDSISFIEFVKSNFEGFDIYFTATDSFIRSNPDINYCEQGVVFVKVENRGRDILPYLELISHSKFPSYEFLVKVHAKGHLANDPERMICESDLKEIRSMFSQGKINIPQRLGGICIPSSRVATFSRYSVNLSYRLMSKFCTQYLRKELPSSFEYSAGTIFVVNKELCNQQKNLLPLARRENGEPIDKDHNLVHYCERLLCVPV